MRTRDPLARPAALAGLLAALLILGAALIGVTIRLLPWVLDPTIGRSTLTPFAKSLLAVALEAALMIAWPVGCALATQRLVDRGEGLVLATLGERPARTVVRLVPVGIAFGVALVLCSALLGRDAVAPGRVVNALIAEGRSSCASGVTRGIPFVSATWLCPSQVAGVSVPRLVGKAPIGNVVFTAEDARVSDDLRRIELAEAKLALPAGESTNIRVHTTSLVLRGLAPWARASALPPGLRALVVTASSLVAGCAAAAAILRARRRVSGVAAAAIGASGPVAALVLLRALELRMPETSPGAWLLLFALVPFLALAAALGAAALVTALPEKRGTDTK